MKSRGERWSKSNHSANLPFSSIQLACGMNQVIALRICSLVGQVESTNFFY